MSNFGKSWIFLSLMSMIIVVIGSQGNCWCVPASQCADGGGAIRPRQENMTKSACPTGERYCCVIITPAPTTTTTIPPPLPHCGLQKTTPVHGSWPLPPDAANFGEFPWMVKILDSKGKFLGSGALIGESTVLTVAHLFETIYRHPNSIIIGEWNDADALKPKSYPWLKPYGLKPIEVFVEKFIPHPEYNSINLQNDIALIKLKTPVDMRQDNPQIGTVCLPWNTFVDQRCFLSTFGDEKFPMIKKVDLSVLPDFKCESNLRKSVLGESFILNRKSFICASNEPGKVCQGHGGAPLVCEFKGHYQVAGLVSWGLTDDDCNDKWKHPGVYTNVHSYIDWIYKVTE